LRCSRRDPRGACLSQRPQSRAPRSSLFLPRRPGSAQRRTPVRCSVVSARPMFPMPPSRFRSHRGSRKIGEVQWPTSLPGDPRVNFMTVSADYIDKQAFAASIAAYAKRTGPSKVLVFVHGFNNRFDDAVYRFAQIVQDSRAPVIPVLFTWPSWRIAVAGVHVRQRKRELFA
jgi:hypothetical protein